MRDGVGTPMFLSSSPSFREQLHGELLPPPPAAQYFGMRNHGDVVYDAAQREPRTDPGPPTSHRCEVSGALGFVEGKRADGGEDDEGKREQQDLPEMGVGSPHPSTIPVSTPIFWAGKLRPRRLDYA